jgi:hypothetical protein
MIGVKIARLTSPGNAAPSRTFSGQATHRKVSAETGSFVGMSPTGSADDEGGTLTAAGLTGWIDRPIERLVTSITEIELSAREATRNGPSNLRRHERYFSSVPALREIELGGVAPVRERTGGPVRVAVWNVERLRHVEAIAELLNRTAPAWGQSRPPRVRLPDLADRKGPRSHHRTDRPTDVRPSTYR